MRLTFAYPWILYLLWSVPLGAVLLYYLRLRQRTKRTSFTGPTLASKLMPPAKPRLEWLQISAVLLALTLLLIAAAGPRSTSRREQEVTMRGRDLVLLIDVSRSMLANDVHPSRLVRAKADMLDILDAIRPGDRVALVAFRNRATRITPFTTDQRFLRQAIAGLSIHSAPTGETDIAAAIQTALTVFDDDSPAHKAVIMISDGEDLSGDAIRAAQTAGQRRIPFITVGLGSRAGSTIPDPDSPRGILLHTGEPVITRLEEESLVTLARLTGGAYIPVETAGMGSVTLGQRTREHLRSVEVQAYATIETGDHAELYTYLLLPAILLLLLAGSLSQGQLRTARHQLALCAILLAASQPAAAQTDPQTPPPPSNSGTQHRTLARQAQARQQEGDPAAAAQIYLEAANQPGVPARLQERYRYNAAIAALQAGDHETATTLLAKLPPIHQANLARALTQFESGRQAADGSPDGYQQRLEQWQDAARLMQRYWQQAGSPDAAQDLETLDALLPHAAQEANLADILERYAETAPDQLAWQMLQDQRTQQSTTNSSTLPPVGPERLRYFEDQTRNRRELADQYLALFHNLQAAENPPDSIQMLAHEQAEIARQAESLRDLVTPEPASPAEIGHPLYNTWRAIGSPQNLLSESQRQQQWLHDLSNAQTTRQPPVSAAELQSEAAALTERFADRYQPPPETEPETLEQIHALTEEAARLQRLAAEMLALNDQAGAQSVQDEARNALLRLAALLPEPPPPENDQQQEEEQDQDPSEPPDGQPEGETGESPDMVPPPPDPDEGDEEQETETPPEEPDGETEEDTFDLDAMLEQVEQRAQEYRDRVEERQQRARQRGAKDW